MAFAAFLICIGFHYNNEDDRDSHGNGVEIDRKIRHVVEPFERQLLMPSQGSSIIRIRGAPTTANTFHRCGSMAMLMRHGGSPGDHDNNGESLPRAAGCDSVRFLGQTSKNALVPRWNRRRRHPPPREP
mmetsp:Transcript_13086/g.24896  ORF Transcript_13086/g.24896 Transcript_13086/m.24896 type:complete len:129 (+) Transcript_13086:539-925(+)